MIRFRNRIVSASKVARVPHVLSLLLALALLAGCGASSNDEPATATPDVKPLALPTPTVQIDWNFGQPDATSTAEPTTQTAIRTNAGGMSVAANPAITPAIASTKTPTPVWQERQKGPVPPFAPSLHRSVSTPTATPPAALLAAAQLPRVPHLYKGEASLNGGSLPPLMDVELPQTLAQGWDKSENFLFMGTDRQNGANDWRTDSLMVVGLNRETGTAAILSIPRDLYVNIPGYGWGRINQADIIGERRRLNGGPDLLGNIIESHLGIPIDHWVRFHMDGFIPLIDALGGVTITLDTPFYDMWQSPTSEQRVEMYLPAGENLLDGQQAYLFSRLRYVGSDIGRASRQRAVIWALRDKFSQGDFLLRLPELFTAFQQSLSTDLTIVDILFLAREALNLDQRQIHADGISLADLQSYTTNTGAQVLLMNDPLRVRAVVERVWSDEAETLADSFRGNAPGTLLAPATPTPVTSTITNTTTITTGVEITEGTPAAETPTPAPEQPTEADPPAETEQSTSPAQETPVPETPAPEPTESVVNEQPSGDVPGNSEEGETSAPDAAETATP